MFDPTTLSHDQLDELVDALPALDSGVSDAQRVDWIRALERLKAAAAAAQAQVTTEFVASQRAAQAAPGYRPTGRAEVWPARWGWPSGSHRRGRADTSAGRRSW